MSSSSPNDNPLAEDLAHILEHTRELWEGVRGQNVFVTGGTGFFGRWLLESFSHINRALQLRASLIVLSRNPLAFAAKAPALCADPAIIFATGDVRTFTLEQLRTQIPEAANEFGFVIHAATESSTNLGNEDPLRMFDTIVQGTRSALEFAAASGARRFLLTSSGAVYGRQPPDLTHMPEDFAGAPDCTKSASAYGEGKRAAESLCVCFGEKHGIQTMIARCFAFVGPFLPLDAHFAVGNFMRDALAGKPIQVGGDGRPLRSYLHAADLAIWLWTVLLKGQPGRCYNVGSEDDRTIKQIAEVVAEIGGAPAVTVAQAPDTTKPGTRYIPSCSRARDELQLQEWIDFPAAIRRTLNVLKRQRQHQIP